MKIMRILHYFLILTVIFSALLIAGCNISNSSINSTAEETSGEPTILTDYPSGFAPSPLEPVIVINNQSLPLSTSRIFLKKEDIESFQSFEELVDMLRNFPELILIDFGECEINVQEAKMVKEKLPDTEIHATVYAMMFGQKIYDNTEEIRIEENFTADELRDAIAVLPNLRVIESEFPIQLDDKDSLKNEFSDITFNIPGILDVFGVQARDDAEEIDLSSIKIDKTLPESLKRLSNISKVLLYNTGIDIETQTFFVNEFPNIHFCWDVEIAGNSYDSETEDLDLSGKKSLTYQELTRIMPLMMGMKRIDVSDCAASNEELGTLRGMFPDVKIVWRIYMGKWKLKTDAIAFSVLIYRFDYTRMTSKDIQVLKYCTDLQALDIGHQAITDISVIGDYLPNLRVLILADNKISNISPLSKLKHLHYLELFMNPLSDTSPLSECKELVDLNVSWTKVKEVSGLLDLPLLERCWIQHTGAP
ncbi:MAG: leucine-rich repeat domain-containing protein, partial [Lachnospiraceae bacterium]|nr:leucine-rich repeat domain-containing protein [Lachnospiraceae bacterium]